MRKAFTLVEVLVVLLLMGLVVLVAPAFLQPRRKVEPPLSPLLRTGRETAIRRAELVYLYLGPDGEWRLRGAASREQGDLATGHLAGFSGPRLTLVFSPIGTCSFDARSAGAARALALDPLTCELPPASGAGALR